MKKIFFIVALLGSCFFVGCASTDQVAELKTQEPETAVVKSENPAATEEKKSEPETETPKSAETTPPETKSAETKTVESKPVETKSTETKKEEVKPTENQKTEVVESTKTEEEAVNEEQTPELAVEDSGASYIKEASSLDSACKIAKFNLTAPKTFAVYKQDKFSAIEETKVNVVYVNSKNAEEKIAVRKGVGNLDVSEDGTAYSKMQILDYGGIRVMAYGEDEDLFNVATWTSGDYSYSVETNVAFPKDVIFALIQELY